mgnify:CR=1 FL=1
MGDPHNSKRSVKVTVGLGLVWGFFFSVHISIPFCFRVLFVSKVMSIGTSTYQILMFMMLRHIEATYGTASTWLSLFRVWLPNIKLHQLDYHYSVYDYPISSFRRTLLPYWVWSIITIIDDYMAIAYTRTIIHNTVLYNFIQERVWTVLHAVWRYSYRNQSNLLYWMRWTNTWIRIPYSAEY